MEKISEKRGLKALLEIVKWIEVGTQCQPRSFPKTPTLEAVWEWVEGFLEEARQREWEDELPPPSSYMAWKGNAMELDWRGTFTRGRRVKVTVWTEDGQLFARSEVKTGTGLPSRYLGRFFQDIDWAETPDLGRRIRGKNGSAAICPYCRKIYKKGGEKCPHFMGTKLWDNGCFFGTAVWKK